MPSRYLYAPAAEDLVFFEIHGVWQRPYILVRVGSSERVGTDGDLIYFRSVTPALVLICLRK
jgi:hypothetical protein